MSRRVHRDAAFSLFSFQDIITAVTGIIILIMLILTLDLLQRLQHKVQSAPRDIAGDMRQQIAQLKSEADKIDASLKSANNDLVNAASFSPEQLEQETHTFQQKVSRLQQDSFVNHENKNQQKSKLKDHQTKVDVASINKNLAQIKETNKKLKKELKKAQTTPRRTYRTEAEDSQTTWIIDIQSDSIQVKSLEPSRSPITFSGTLAFLDWAQKQSIKNSYFVLLIRPEGIVNFQVIYKELDSDGFSIGFDVVPERTALFSE